MFKEEKNNKQFQFHNKPISQTTQRMYYFQINDVIISWKSQIYG